MSSVRPSLALQQALGLEAIDEPVFPSSWSQRSQRVNGYTTEDRLLIRDGLKAMDRLDLAHQVKGSASWQEWLLAQSGPKSRGDIESAELLRLKLELWAQGVKFWDGATDSSLAGLFGYLQAGQKLVDGAEGLVLESLF